MERPHPTERRTGPSRPRRTSTRRGQALLGALLWILARLVLGGPFLRQADAPEWSRPDPNRNPETDLPFWEDVAEFDARAREED